MGCRNLLLLASLGASVVGCSSKPMVVVDVNRIGEGTDRVAVEFDRSRLDNRDVVYIAQESLEPGHERLSISPEAKSMALGNIRVRVIVETVGPTTRP